MVLLLTNSVVIGLESILVKKMPLHLACALIMTKPLYMDWANWCLEDNQSLASIAPASHTPSYDWGFNKLRQFIKLRQFLCRGRGWWWQLGIRTIIAITRTIVGHNYTPNIISNQCMHYVVQLHRCNDNLDHKLSSIIKQNNTTNYSYKLFFLEYKWVTLMILGLHNVCGSLPPL